MLTEFLLHTAARLLSAAWSFLLFALVARYCAVADAKAIYFFSFSLGFLVFALRSFGTIAAGLHGSSRRSQKLRTVLEVTGYLLPIQIVSLGVATIALTAKPISNVVVVAGAFIVAASSFDSDIARAALGKRSSFSLWFAVGGALALAVFLAAPVKSVSVGCGALIVQWMPVACVNAYFYLRLLRRRGRAHQMMRRARAAPVFGAVVVSVFDGVVLNAPFLVGGPISSGVGFDLSIAARVFSSSLPLAPLIRHWSNSGALGAAATKLRVNEQRLYGVVLGASGIVGGGLLSVLYSTVSGKPVTALQYGLALALLWSYSYYAPAVRYHTLQSSAHSRVVGFGAILGGFFGVFGLATRLWTPSAMAIVALQSGALVVGAVFLRYVGRAIWVQDTRARSESVESGAETTSSTAASGPP